MISLQPHGSSLLSVTFNWCVRIAYLVDLSMFLKRSGAKERKGHTLEAVRHLLNQVWSLSDQFPQPCTICSVKWLTSVGYPRKATFLETKVVWKTFKPNTISNVLTSIVSLWISLDPLIISASLVHIYNRVSDLLCRNDKHQDCHCEVIRGHYGRRPFKCGFLDCSFRRHGFELRALQKSHIKHHGRPWKCNIEDCEYAEGGFLSRKMRDDHYQDHILKEP